MPKNLVPYHYDLTIKPYFKVDEVPKFYDGHVIINFTCIEDTNKLVLNMKNLDLNYMLINSDQDSDFSMIKQSTCNQNKLVYFQKPFGEIIYPLGAVGSCIPPPPSTQESAPIIPSSFNPYFTFDSSPVYQIYNPDYFTGTWIVDGINCNNKNVSLQVKIDGILAIVSEGNDCYEDGSVLFLGNLPGVLDNKNSISVNYYTDGMQMSRVWLSITGNNTFVIPKYNLILFRKLN